MSKLIEATDFFLFRASRVSPLEMQHSVHAPSVFEGENEYVVFGRACIQLFTIDEKILVREIAYPQGFDPLAFERVEISKEKRFIYGIRQSDLGSFVVRADLLLQHDAEVVQAEGAEIWLDSNHIHFSKKAGDLLEVKSLVLDSECIESKPKTSSFECTIEDEYFINQGRVILYRVKKLGQNIDTAVRVYSLDRSVLLTNINVSQLTKPGFKCLSLRDQEVWLGESMAILAYKGSPGVTQAIHYLKGNIKRSDTYINPASFIEKKYESLFEGSTFFEHKTKQLCLRPPSQFYEKDLGDLGSIVNWWLIGSESILVLFKLDSLYTFYDLRSHRNIAQFPIYERYNKNPYQFNFFERDSYISAKISPLHDPFVEEGSEGRVLTLRVDIRVQRLARQESDFELLKINISPSQAGYLKQKSCLQDIISTTKGGIIVLQFESDILIIDLLLFSFFFIPCNLEEEIQLAINSIDDRSILALLGKSKINFIDIQEGKQIKSEQLDIQDHLSQDTVLLTGRDSLGLYWLTDDHTLKEVFFNKELGRLSYSTFFEPRDLPKDPKNTSFTQGAKRGLLRRSTSKKHIFYRSEREYQVINLEERSIVDRSLISVEVEGDIETGGEILCYSNQECVLSKSNQLFIDTFVGGELRRHTFTLSSMEALNNVFYNNGRLLRIEGETLLYDIIKGESIDLNISKISEIVDTQEFTNLSKLDLEKIAQRVIDLGVDYYAFAEKIIETSKMLCILGHYDLLREYILTFFSRMHQDGAFQELISFCNERSLITSRKVIEFSSKETHFCQEDLPSPGIHSYRFLYSTEDEFRIHFKELRRKGRKKSKIGQLRMSITQSILSFNSEPFSFLDEMDGSLDQSLLDESFSTINLKASSNNQQTTDSHKYQNPESAKKARRRTTKRKHYKKATDYSTEEYTMRK